MNEMIKLYIYKQGFEYKKEKKMDQGLIIWFH
jgi:hypothetical protein